MLKQPQPLNINATMTFIIGRQPRATASDLADGKIQLNGRVCVHPIYNEACPDHAKDAFFKTMQEFNYVARNMRTQLHTSHAESQEDTDSLSAHLSEVCPLGRLT